MASQDWSRFVTRINVNAPLQTLYNAWATRAGMESWFLRLSEYKKPDGVIRKNDEPVQKDDTYRWMWHGWPDSMVEHGKILELNGKDYFKFSFGNAGNVAITIRKEEGENIVELVQDNIPSDEESKFNWHIGCKTGWTFYLANLKSILEGGIDLRNKNEKIQQVINS